MSSSALPIPPERFAEAILDLPLATLHLKAAEIRNSISHLESSNFQLQRFADEGDEDCGDAIEENKETMLRMEERIVMLKGEVERRGFQWGFDVAREGRNEQQSPNGDVERRGLQADLTQSPASNGEGVAIQQRQTSVDGSLGDAALARRISGRAENHDEEVESGIHL